MNTPGIVNFRAPFLDWCTKIKNTPTIIRFPFENLLRSNKNISLIRLNLDEAVIPESLETQAVGINADMGKTIEDIVVLDRQLSQER